MNERIKELMEYAVRFRLDPDSNAYEALVQPEDLELFAELIVRECMNLVKDCYAEDESGKSQYQTVCASTIIEDHFGVEE